ncbi:RHS repeat-associated core domain-containing protein [Microbulbifer sp. SAOS-129_SWC]|uniref:RHS repeat-associated core domain-containing protein n=1 Tax=Microbulbifer sp. SAOS-129_SWC TaxID=3145235 RepID=UPI003216AA22
MSWNSTSGAESYNLEESGASSGSWTQSGISRTFTKSTDGNYSYRVQSCSIYSGVTSCSGWTGLKTVVITLPDFFVQNVDRGEVQLVWKDWAVDKVTLKRGGVTIYDSGWSYSGQGRTYTDTLSVSGSYSYTLVGWQCINEGAGGSCIQNSLGSRGPVSADVLIEPSVPNLSIDTGSSTNTSYSGMLGITSTSTGPIDQVQWQMRTAGGSWPTQSQISSSTSFTVSDLADGNYEFRSKNCNAEGCSSNWSATAGAEIWKINPPSQPVINAISNSTDGLVNISWQDLTGEFADKYEIYENGSTSPTYTLTSNSGNKKAPNTPHSYQPAELADGSYSYVVVACNPAGCSAPSNSRSLIVAHRPTDPGAPSHADTSSGSVYVTWDVAPGADIYYELQQREVDGTWSDSGLGAIQYNEAIVRGLTQSDWQFSVRACNKYAWSCSDYSPASAAVAVVPAPGWANTDYVSVENALNTMGASAAHARTVGALSAAGSVSGGQASYRVQIHIPPGRNKVQPSVNLSYSSQGGNGVLGMGWSISATSAISRCGETLVHDGVIKPVQYSSSDDRLCLDGQRLLLISGTYGSSGAVYRKELDDFTRITQSGGINSSGTYFVAELKNGRIRYYGNSADSRHTPAGAPAPLSWAISREEDRTVSANSIVYKYGNNGSGEYLLDNIYYTGNGSTQGNRRINFVYEPRPDVSSRYLAGGLTRQTKRLDKIFTYVGSAKVLEYRTGYKVSDASQRSLLSSLQECGYEGSSTKCHTATNFTWEDAAESFALEKVGYVDSSGNFVEQLQGAREIADVSPKGDADGNGVVDWPTWQQDAEGRFVSTKSDDLHTCQYSFITQSRNCASGDFNQDGKTDSWRSQNGILEIAYSSNNWISTGIPMAGSGGGEFVSYISDFNRDGRPDIVIERGNCCSGDIYLYLHTGDDSAPFVDNGKKIYSYDSSDGVHRTTSVQFVGDMDGNGVPDFVEFNNDLPINNGSNLSRQPMPVRMFLAESASPSTVTFSPVTMSAHAQPDMTTGVYYFHYFLDVNGDGLLDWITWEHGGGLLLSLNQGGGVFSDWSTIQDSAGLIETKKFPYYHSASAEWRIAVYARYSGGFRQFDIDADGRNEILMPGTRLVTSCQKLSSFEGTSTLQQITVCGDDLYDKLLDYSSDAGRQWHAIDVDNLDDSVYQYNALKFVENSDGTFKAELVPTEIVGSATQSAAFDGFGNGLQDLVFTYGCRNEWCSISSDSGVMSGKAYGAYINRNRGSATGSERYEPTDMLVAAEDGFGVRDEWRYRPLSSRDSDGDGVIDDRPFYERGGYLDNLDQATRLDHFEFTSSMYVVAEHSESNGIGGLNATEYRYKGAVYNHKGRGFQGFHTIIEEDQAANIETQSDFHQIFPLAGKLYKQRKWELGDRVSDSDSVDPFEESSFVWQFWPKGGQASPVTVSTLADNWSVSANDPYFVGPQEQSTVHRTLGKSGNSRTELYTQSQTSSFDQWGNLLSAESRYEEANSSHIVSSTTDTQYVTADQSNWWLNKPLQQTVTKHAIQNRNGVAIASGTDNDESLVVDYLLWDDDARKPSQVKTTPSDGKWSQVDTIYNSDGLPTKVTTTAQGETASRFVQTTAFSTDGYFPKTVKNALGHAVTTVTNAAFGKPDSVTDANGLTTSFGYDAFGRAITVTAPSALGLKTAPDAHTALQWCSPCSSAPSAVYKTIKQQAGKPTQISYHDSLGRVIRNEVQAFDGADWVVTEKQFNALGQVTFQSVPHYTSAANSYGTRYLAYDTLGRALHKTVDQTNGQLLDIHYTHEQNLGFTTQVNVNGRLMYRTYNGLQQLTQTVDALQGSTDYAYDGAGNPIVLQDALGNRIIAEYNALGQKKSVDDPNMGLKSFTYTGFGEVESETDAKLQVVEYHYDQLGRIDQRLVDGTIDASWTYDAAANGIGLPDKAMTGDGDYSRSYHYDALSRPDQVTTTIAGEDFVTLNQYDHNLGRLKGMTYPDGLTLQYSYNSAGYRYRTSNAGSDYTYREITQMDAWGEWEFANVAAGNYTIGRDFYDQTGQMSGSTFDNLIENHQALAYDYDNFGNLWHKTVQVPSASPSMNTETYTYDALNRLDYSSRTNGPAIDYDYDAIGNLLKKDDFATSYDYSGGSTGGPSAVKSVALIGGGSVGYCYDANGNRIGEAAGGSCSPGSNQNIWYNAFNKPLHISRNGTDLYFSYGADQKRYRQINQTSGKTTVYIDKLFERISGGGGTRYRHYIDDIAVVTNTSGASGTSYAVGFTHRDRLGSTVAIGDESGNLKETHSFDPFGKPRQGNILDKAVPTLESSFTTRGFTDHEHLDDVELIHMNGRAYDYNLGRFLSVDPVVQAPGNSQSLNPYSYIMNNPLAGTDPSGYCAASRLASICGNLPTANWGGSVTDMARKNHAVSAQGNGFNNQAINNALSKAKIPGAASEKLSLGARENVQQVKDASGQSVNAASTGVLPWGAAGSLLGVGARFLTSLFGMSTLLTSSSYDNPDDYITVYRGTDLRSEIEVQKETGLIMSDAARNYYQEKIGDKFWSGEEVTARMRMETAAKAGVVAVRRHAELVAMYGGEENLARVQTSAGTEFPNPPRSMFSVTTDLSVARKFARGGAVYMQRVNRHKLIETPVNGSESEYFIRAQMMMERIE